MDDKVTPLARNQRDIIQELEFLLERTKQGRISRLAYVVQGPRGFSRAAEITSDKKAAHPGRLLKAVLPEDPDEFEII